MKLRALELESFRKFDRPVRLNGFAPGLNLVVGPNEMGKSTLLAACRAALFERHSGDRKELRGYQPRGHKTAPRVALEFELDDGVYRIEKRFLSGPHACLVLPDGRRLERDHAEDALGDLLGIDRGERGLGTWALLLAQQGESWSTPEVSAPARLRLQACLEAEVGHLLGVDRNRELVASIERDLNALVTSHGRPRPRGRYAEALRGLQNIAAEIESLCRRRDALAEERARLAGAQDAHQRLAAEIRASPEPGELPAARKLLEDLGRREPAIREAEATLAAARLGLQRAQDLARRRAELARLRAEAAAAQTEAEQVAKSIVELEEALGDRQAAIERLRAEEREIAARRERLSALESALRERDGSRAALEALAVEVRFDLEPAALARVRTGRQPLTAADQRLRSTEPLEVQIEGIGRITVQPAGPRHVALQRRLAESERSVERLSKGLAGGPQARRQRAASAQLDLGLAPTPAEDAPPDPAAWLADVKERQEALASELDRAERAQAGVEYSRSEQRQAHAGVRAKLDAMSAAIATLETEIGAETADGPESAQEADLEPRQQAVHEAEARLLGLREGITDEPPDKVAVRIARLEQVIEGRARRLDELHFAIRELLADIQSKAGEGLDERLAELERQRAELERERAHHEREVQVLTLLRDTLLAAELAAKEQYLAPVLERLHRHLELLLPGAAALLGDDLRVARIHRAAEGEEPFDEVSHGTREQIAVLARLAFAELLSDQGRPAVVILDDALVYSDDRRLERMFEILVRAAEKFQIIVLTCRERVFEGLDARRLRLEPGEAALAEAHG
jgi:DNA repair exonuclease SbcCD ATPase subunit